MLGVVSSHKRVHIIMRMLSVSFYLEIVCVRAVVGLFSRVSQ